MTQRNPIYQALKRTRIVYLLIEKYEWDGRVKPAFDQYAADSAALTRFRDIGAISTDVFYEAIAVAFRPLAAAALIAHRQDQKPAQRRLDVRRALEADAEGYRR